MLQHSHISPTTPQLVFFGCQSETQCSALNSAVRIGVHLQALLPVNQADHGELGEVGFEFGDLSHCPYQLTEHLNFKFYHLQYLSSWLNHWNCHTHVSASVGVFSKMRCGPVLIQRRQRGLSTKCLICMERNGDWVSNWTHSYNNWIYFQQFSSKNNLSRADVLHKSSMFLCHCWPSSQGTAM